MWYFIASNFSEIIIRDENFKPCIPGQRGFVQLMSLLPSSYPGHSIPEDIGEIVNDPKCKVVLVQGFYSWKIEKCWTKRL